MLWKLTFDEFHLNQAIVNSASEVLCHNNDTVGVCDISYDDNGSCFDVSSFDSDELEVIEYYNFCFINPNTFSTSDCCAKENERNRLVNCRIESRYINHPENTMYREIV